MVWCGKRWFHELPRGVTNEGGMPRGVTNEESEPHPRSLTPPPVTYYTPAERPPFTYRTPDPDPPPDQSLHLLKRARGVTSYKQQRSRATAGTPRGGQVGKIIRDKYVHT